jgi:8-oxoguanine DNA glycosylase-like protein
VAVLPMPPGLANLVARYRGDGRKPVAFDTVGWESALRDSTIDVKFLRDDRWTSPSSLPGRRLVDWRGITRLVAETDLNDPDPVRVAFALVTVWACGTKHPNGYRLLPRALAVSDSGSRLSAAAQRCRAGVLAEAYNGFSLTGVERSLFTKWFAAAGVAPDRPWQPLILDDRVTKTLNDTFDISTRALAGTRDRGARYASYVEHLHAWSIQLTDAGQPCSAQRLEWLMFKHQGRSLPGRR